MSSPERSAILKKRDMKVRATLEQFAPVWLVEDRMEAQDDADTFTVVFQHNLYGWVSRRYRYDAFNDTLYYLGQMQMPEEKAIEITERDPYITTTISDVANAYGG